jgi:hypothetical protein
MSNTHHHNGQPARYNGQLVRLEADAAGVTIRDAVRADLDALERLAQRDTARRPDYPMLVAEVGGELRAAYSLSETRSIADPFHRTAELVELLEVHARQLDTRVTGGATAPYAPRSPRPTPLTRAARA